MRLLKKNKKIYDKKVFYFNKFYLVFVFFNMDVSILNLLKMILEGDLGFKVYKTIKNSNSFTIYLETDIKNYFNNVKELNEFFLDEDFKFYYVSVYFKENHIQPFFFENEFVDSIDIFEFEDEIIHYFYIKLLNFIINNKKLIFLIYNILVLNKTLLKFNVYNSPSSF